MSGQRPERPATAVARPLVRPLILAPGPALAALFCGLALPFLVATMLPPANHDMAAILHFTERWIDGERLYVDLIDMNPPLIFLLSAVPIALARLCALDPIVAAALCVHGLGAWSMLACHRILATRLQDLGGFPLILLPLAMFLIGPLAGHNFGQREHLMLLAALPYLCLGDARLANISVPPRLAIAMIVVATLGFCLKPHFLAVPALIELWFLRRRDLGPFLRSTSLAWMSGVGLSYAALIAIAFPDYLAQIVPLARAHYAPSLCCLTGLDALGHLSVPALLTSPEVARIGVVAIPAALLSLRRDASALSRLLALAALGGLIAGLAQRKGWAYHFLPFEGLVAALLACLAADHLVPALRDLAVRRRAAAILGLVALATLTYGHVLGARDGLQKAWLYQDAPAGRLAMLLRHEAAGQPVLVLSIGMYPLFPALNQARARLLTPFMNLWILNSAYRACLPDGRLYRDPEDMEEHEALLFSRVIADFVRVRPAIVIVDRETGMPECGKKFDFLVYFRRDPGFASAFSTYRRVKSLGSYDIYARA